MYYPRGSEWRLWDLHIHTPASYNYSDTKFSDMSASEKTAAINQIISNINDSDVSVFAINDYWTFDGYLALRAAHDAGNTIRKTIFPGIELRIESATSHRLNIHVLLSDKVTSQQLMDFKGRLRLQVTDRTLSSEAIEEFARNLDPAKARVHGATGNYLEDPKQLLRIGAETAVITKASFEDALKSIPEEFRLVMIPYDSYGGTVKINWRTQASEQLYFMRLADIIEERDQENIDLFIGNKTPTNEAFIENIQFTIGGHPKPCISGSDGHSISAFRTWRSETSAKKTWIKSDPTFEGLRQILFEPAERVRVQENDPSLDFDKPYFHSISITNSMELYPQSTDRENPAFEKNSELPLNPNMVCIIGGRGTGKSRLMDYLGRAFGGIGQSQEAQAYVYRSDFAIKYNKDLQSSEIHEAASRPRLPFVYISQSEVKDRVSHGKVGDELRRMLDISISKTDENLSSQITTLLDRVKLLENWFSQKDSEDKLINDSEQIESELEGYRSLLESITTDTNKEKLHRFTENVRRITATKEKIRQLDIFLAECASTLQNLNIHAQRIDSRIPEISVGLQIRIIHEIKEESTAVITQCNIENDSIKAEFSQIYTGDLSTLLSNAETYKSAIEDRENRLRIIAQYAEDLKKIKQDRSGIPKFIGQDLMRQKIEIDSKWSTVKAGRADWSDQQRKLMQKILADREIALEGAVIFRPEVFSSLLKELLNLTYFRASRDATVENKIHEKFPIRDYVSFLKFMEEGLHEVETAEFIKGDLIKLFYDSATRSKYLCVEPKITYRGRPLEKLSIGQRGTVYLCLKLATQAFSQPLIFDQPEDDLDNEFIVSELVEIFRGIKKYRQVILITHNANIVVNGDAEQVIIAENDGGNLSYSSGSLEHSETNKRIRLILEGGDLAFRKRERRYTLHS